MPVSLIIPSFVAGLLTFLAPCTLPLVPGYLAFISGVSTQDLQNPQQAKGLRKKIFLNGLTFVAGLSLVFIIFGSLAGVVGVAFAPYRIWLSRIGGIVVIIFGLILLRLIRIPFLITEKQLKIPIIARGKPLNSFLLGSAFGFGWTPCVGPILASILVLVSTSATIWQGAFLLFIFSIGLAIPFLLVAAGSGSVLKFTDRYPHLLNWLNYLGGAFLIGLGVVLLTNNMAWLISTGYRLLLFINYDQLLRYL